jgi:hypothetical protein
MSMRRKLRKDVKEMQLEAEEVNTEEVAARNIGKSRAWSSLSLHHAFHADKPRASVIVICWWVDSCPTVPERSLGHLGVIAG